LKGADLIIEAQAEGAVSKESIDPVHQERIEAPIGQNDPEAVPVNIVEKPRDIKKKGPSSPVDFVGERDMMCQCESSVQAA